MDSKVAYIEVQKEVVVEYKLLYPEANSYPTIESLLENIPRKDLIQISLLLVNQFSNVGFEEIERFFSFPQSVEVRDFKYRFERATRRGINYIFCTDQTSLELLRYTFSIEYVPRDLDVEEYEINLFKAILLINEKLHVFDDFDDEDSSIRIAKILLLEYSSQKGINDSDYFQVFREIFTKSIYFFEYVSTDGYFKPVYMRFLEINGIDDFKKYIKTILGICALMSNNAKKSKEVTGIEQKVGIFNYNPEKDKDIIISENLLERLALNWDEFIPLKNNHDYTLFREFPMIKYEENSYVVFNRTFLIEKLFNSLYFEFQKIAKEDLKLKDFENEYKESFFEKSLFVKYLEKINKEERYFALNSKQMKDICNHKGEPDYYLKNIEGNVILFEHKDIKISDKIKQSRDIELIISEYKNKLLLNTKSNGKNLENAKPVGIGQLITSIIKIRNDNFIWDPHLNHNVVVYPVIVLTDSNFIPDGLPYLMNDWFQKELEKENIANINVRPLAIMTTSTLSLYSQHFIENGLEFYLDQYYESLKVAETKTSGDVFLNIANFNISFSDYMIKAVETDYLELFEEYKKKIFN